MDIAGLDLSLTSTGYSRPNGETLCIASGKRRGVERLDWMQDRILEAVLSDGPELVVVEGYAYGIRDTATRGIAELHGVVMLALYRWGIPTVEVNPQTLKMYALGGGKAKKEQMLAEALSRFGLRFTTNDECDAFWLRAIALDHYGSPVAVMPAKNRSYMEKVAWPE
jgi:Holliday junction resolvasome RuvABC endonuclease subunit